MIKILIHGLNMYFLSVAPHSRFAQCGEGHCRIWFSRPVPPHHYPLRSAGGPGRHEFSDLVLASSYWIYLSSFHAHPVSARPSAWRLTWMSCTQPNQPQAGVRQGGLGGYAIDLFGGPRAIKNIEFLAFLTGGKVFNTSTNLAPITLHSCRLTVLINEM